MLVIMSVRQISCIATPPRHMTGIPSEPNVDEVIASAAYSYEARNMKNNGIIHV